MATAPAVLHTSISPTNSLPPFWTDFQFFHQKQPMISALHPRFYAWFHSRRKVTAGDTVWPRGCWWLPSFAATQHSAWCHIHSGYVLGTQSPHPAQPSADGCTWCFPPRHCFAASDLESSCLTVMQPQHCYVLLQLAAVMFCFYYLKQLCIGGHGTSLLTCFPSHLEYYEQHQFQHSHWGLPRETHWYEA